MKRAWNFVYGTIQIDVVAETEKEASETAKEIMDDLKKLKESQ